MPVSGLVVTFQQDPKRRREALAAIRQEPRIELGPMEAGRLAIVVDTQTSQDDKQLWQWLNSLPGVEFVDVAMVGYEESS